MGIITKKIIEEDEREEVKRIHQKLKTEEEKRNQRMKKEEIPVDAEIDEKFAEHLREKYGNNADSFANLELNRYKKDLQNRTEALRGAILEYVEAVQSGQVLNMTDILKEKDITQAAIRNTKIWQKETDYYKAKNKHNKLRKLIKIEKIYEVKLDIEKCMKKQKKLNTIMGAAEYETTNKTKKEIAKEYEIGEATIKKERRPIIEVLEEEKEI